jgi:hypothetical protein
MKSHLLMKTLFLIFILGILAFYGCKKDNDNNQSEEKYNLITSQAIGKDGGSIISDDVIIEIPKNALSSSALIELYSSTTKNPFGDEGNSDVFWLKGLPDQLNAPLKLSVRYQGSLTDLNYIGFGKYVIATSGQDTALSEILLTAVDSSGFLQAFIPAGQVDLLKSVQYQGNYGIPFFSINNYWYYQTDHFLINFPGRYKSTGAVEALAAGLEGAYDTLLGMGFLYTARTSWPLDVTVKQLPPEVDGQTNRSFPWTSNSGYIEISTDIMTDKPLLTITGAHEFFHIVQDLYNSDEKYNWLQEASSVWFEEKYSSNPVTYVSGARQGHELEPYSGLQAGGTNNETHHGYGCSAVLKYAVKTYGQDIIKKIWEDCKDGTHPVETIKNSTDPYVIWYINFMREYFLGTVYSDMGIGQLVYNDKFTINTDQDIQKSFERSYPDLSGYVYIVEPKNANFKAETKLQLTLTGDGRSMYVVKKTGTTFSVIGYDVNQLLIPDLRGLQSSSSTLYIVVTNYLDNPPAYTATTNIKIDMTVVNSGQTYINYYASKTDIIGLCMYSNIPNFLIDVSSVFTSQANDFRITEDSVWFNSEYKWMEVHYPVPAAGQTKTLHVDVTLANLRKNPASNVTWDPYIVKVELFLYDKLGSNTYTFDGNGNYSFDMVYDQSNPWPYASVTVFMKDVLNQGGECSSWAYTIGLFSE